MSLIILKYSELTTVDGVAILGATWNKVPVNHIVRDDRNNCVINANNSFTLSSKIYPKIVRFNIHVTAVSVSALAMNMKTRLLLLQGASSQVIDTSLNYKLITNQSQGILKQLSSMSLTKPSTLRLELFSTANGLFGRAASDGSEERYASLEITIE